jgi:hypothetical protein
MIKFGSRGAMLLLLALMLLFAGGQPVLAQTSLTSTTLAANVTTTAAKTIQLTSASGFSASTANAQTFAVVDRELMLVQAVSGPYITVIRGWSGSRASAHASGAPVYFVPSVSALVGYLPSGYCVRTNQPYVPLIAFDSGHERDNGTTFDCVGSQWVSTNRPGAPVVGSEVASASTISATGTFFPVSGTTTINTINVPAGWAPGMSLQLNATGAWATGTSGNVSVATTVTSGQTLTLTWNGSKWTPTAVVAPE